MILQERFRSLDQFIEPRLVWIPRLARVNDQVGPSHLHAFGNRQRPAMDPVEAISLHVMRETAGAANAGDKHGLLRPQLLVAAQPLHRRQNGVVAATGAPARHAALIIFKLVMLVVQPQKALGGMNGHGRASYFCVSFSRMTRSIVDGLIGWPRTSLQQSTSMR